MRRALRVVSEGFQSRAVISDRGRILDQPVMVSMKCNPDSQNHNIFFRIDYVMGNRGFMNRSKIILLFFSVFVLFGCVTTEEITQNANNMAKAAERLMNQKAVCCDSFSEMEFNNSDLQSKLDIPINSDRSTFTFPTGKSYFYSLTIPVLDEGELWFFTGWHENSRGNLGSIFYPSAIFLNEEYEVVGQQIDIPICYYQAWTQKNLGFYARIRNIPGNTKSVVIFTNLNTIDQPVEYSSSATTGGVYGVFESTVNYDIPRSVDGSIRLWIPKKDGLEDAVSRRCRW